jgi:hypothetical protein
VSPWLGYASLTSTWTSHGPLVPSPESRYGTSFGIDRFLFFRGQEAFVEYDADIRAGSLYLYVFSPWDRKLGGGQASYVTASGSGEWTVPIHKTGFYVVVIHPTTVRSDDSGWDISYSVRWGARFWAKSSANRQPRAEGSPQA